MIVESGYVSSMEQEEIMTVINSTNSSFQNYSTADAAAGPTASGTRKRGITALLQDVSNLVDQPRSRSAGQKARRTLQKQATLCAPQGNPAQGAATKHRSADPGYSGKSPIAVSSNIANTLMAYIQRNIPYEAQKAIAISVMAVAMSRWNCSVVDAANRATECCRFNAEVVRRWFRAFSSTTSSCSLEDMTDENITTVLSSRRGQHDNHAASLVNDESFCLAARKYVRKHACKKGEPNLTSKTFTEWVESEYNTSICEETA